MTHKRKTIRDAIVTLLDDGSIVSSGKVYSNRSLRILEDDLPVINLFTVNESAERSDISTSTLLRELEVAVEVTTKGSTDEVIDDLLDGLAEKVEQKLSEDDSWNDTVIDGVLSNTEIEADSNGNYPIGTIRLAYTARYLTDS